jgi:hypothetical protein
VSAKQKLPMPRPRAAFFLCLSLALVFAFTPILTCADSLEDAARALARKVAASRIEKAGSEYSWQNHSDLSPATSERMREAFQAELDRQHLSMTESSGADLSIQLTQGPSLIYLIAALSTEKGQTIASVSFPKAQFSAADRVGAVSKIDRQLLWEQPEAVLDLAQLEDSAGKPDLLLVLGRSSLFLYRRDKEQWFLKDSAPLPRGNPEMRDLRGEIHLDDHFFQFHLPGFECDGDAWQKLAFECEERKGIWRAEFDPMLQVPFSLDAGHNFFAVDPHYIGSKKFPLPGFFSASPFYSAEDQEGYQAILAGADGHSYFLQSGNERDHTGESLELISADWGSELITTPISCRENSLILATGPRDRTFRDTLQGFQLDQKTVTPATTVIEFPGPVLSLRPEKRSAAIAIVFNLTTGNYEAYRVTMECGD